ncbi:MAG: PEP/pyruvate-binding domain-containing protein [Sulfuricurvum sp.]|nr:PEP/pyruvate-binding domain-containing protein [Sulfuricurvum sp.]
MKLQLASKAKTLAQLEGHLLSCHVLPQLCFSIEEFLNDQEGILQSIAETFDKVIVRSSAKEEDGFDASHAGCFLSLPNIEAKNKVECASAIQSVIASYGDLDIQNEFFIQPMLSDVSCSGVLFTSDPDTFAPYLIANMDFSGSTDGVTAGHKNTLKTFVCFKHRESELEEGYQKALVHMAKELESVLDNPALDIEFAFINDKLYLLQVRALTSKTTLDLSCIDMSDALHKVSKKIKKLSIPHPALLGSRVIYGVMPDWNPAEIIGIRPKKLALSLYKELVTDSVWAYQRDNFGYRNLRSHPLLVDFLGVPYIDVRVSFNSFVPKGLDEEIAGKLIDYYLDSLEGSPHFHDKVEFEILFSCYTLDLPARLQKLRGYSFREDELKQIEFSLLQLTNNVIKQDGGLYKKDIAKVEQLKKRHRAIVDSHLSLVDKIYWLIEECKRYGTLPFAGIARAAFMATQFLDSFVSLGILSVNQKQNFLYSLNTVSKRLSTDLLRVFEEKMSKDDFLEEYGHLRPGTYDINSLTYAEAFDAYFNSKPYDCKSIDFEWEPFQKEMIASMLLENNLEISFDELTNFIREAIEAREYAKLIFTKSLSQVLVYIEEYGARLGISRADMAHLSIGEIMRLYSSVEASDVAELFDKEIRRNKHEYVFTQAVKFPSLLVTSEDIYHYSLEEGEPNFITLKSVVAQVSIWNEKESIKDKIVCIENADPGYDFLLTKGIAGLITCYGGVNSHMAIRCAESGIPAIIGAGEKLFSNYTRANVIELDAASRVCRVIS